MSATVGTSQRLPETGELKEGQERSPRLIGAECFAAGVGVYELQKQAAIDLGKDPGYLVHMCNGLKPASLEDVFKLKPAGTRASVTAMATHASLVVIPLGDLRLEAREARALRFAREQLGDFWPAYRDRMAAKVFGCTGDLIDMHLDAEALMGK